LPTRHHATCRFLRNVPSPVPYPLLHVADAGLFGVSRVMNLATLGTVSSARSAVRLTHSTVYHAKTSASVPSCSAETEGRYETSNGPTANATIQRPLRVRCGCPKRDAV
jgi:hypothetical protein